MMHGQWATALRQFDKALSWSPFEIRYRYYRLVALQQCYMFDELVEESFQLKKWMDRTSIKSPIISKWFDARYMVPPGHKTWEDFHRAYLKATAGTANLETVDNSYRREHGGKYPPPPGTLFDVSLAEASHARFKVNASAERLRRQKFRMPPPPQYQWSCEAFLRREMQREREEESPRPIMGVFQGQLELAPLSTQGRRKAFTTPSGRLIIPRQKAEVVPSREQIVESESHPRLSKEYQASERKAR